jgi:undecaprenyl-diphosphatase
METDLLLFLHRHANPVADAVFVFSDALATARFCAALVVLACLWHAVRREARLVVAWLVLGLLCMGAQTGLKSFFGRERPQLWPRLVSPYGPAMPSGHALASAAFYPFAAALLARHARRGARSIWALGLLLPLYIGFGRLYLGVHWPSDVLAGWAVGGLLAWGSLRLLVPRAEPTSA